MLFTITELRSAFSKLIHPHALVNTSYVPNKTQRTSVTMSYEHWYCSDGRYLANG